MGRVLPAIRGLAKLQKAEQYVPVPCLLFVPGPEGPQLSSQVHSGPPLRPE